MIWLEDRDRLRMHHKLTGKVDDFLVGFSMKIARDGAWKFAKSLSGVAYENWNKQIHLRDEKVVLKAALITQPSILIQIVFFIVRLGEIGSVSAKMKKLRFIEPKKELLKRIRGKGLRQKKYNNILANKNIAKL